MRKLIFTQAILLFSVLCMAQNSVSTPVTSFLVKGPYPVPQTYMADALSPSLQPRDSLRMLEDFKVTKDGARLIGIDALREIRGTGLLQLTFYLDESDYREVSLKVKGAEQVQTFMDEEPQNGKIRLTPRSHEFTLRILVPEAGLADLDVRLESSAPLSPKDSPVHHYNIRDCLEGVRVISSALSPSGRYLIARYTLTEKGGKVTRYSQVRQTATGKVLARYDAPLEPRWMPLRDAYYLVRTVSQKTQLLEVSPETLEEKVLSTDLPTSNFTMSWDERYLILSLSEEGRKDDPDVFEIIDPDDRQPRWRTRSYLARYDLQTGLTERLTYGSHSARLEDLSRDGRKMLFTVSHSRLTARPTTLTDYLEMDLATLRVDTLVRREGFLESALYSPDASRILFVGSGEAFNGIGLRIKEGQTSSTYDYRLYMMQRSDLSVQPMDPDTNLCISSVVWSMKDGMIYFSAQDRDCESLFRISPEDFRIEPLGSREDVVSGFSLAQAGGQVSYTGMGISNSTRLHLLSWKGKKGWTDRVLDDCSSEVLKDVALGKTGDWSFDNGRGDIIQARYYLPEDFVEGRKYPMVVDYYGGCSPTSRTLESRYPQHAYASQGYVVLVIQPSGATGFGQEFAARHVNTCGEGPAEDIIEGTKQFLREHSFVDAAHVGCIGASYGGFMTMYVLTKTDTFACAVSHAGISNHASYWGEGYWGYSYSEVSCANRYPWTHPEMYTYQSPLFNADKIHTPLLFTHGSDDHNVPVGESIQMFTALKLLGRETAFIQVRGEDHHILTYSKRLKWQDSIFAWFAKHLKNDDSWWESMYPSTPLQD